MALRSIKQGMTGPDVKAIQQGLNRANPGRPIGEDGIFGPETDSAVRRFQAARGLEVDGIVGPHTRAGLFPLVGVTVNVYGFRLGGQGQGQSPLERRLQRAFSPGTLRLGDPPQPGSQVTGPPLLRPPVLPSLPSLISPFPNTLVNLPQLPEPVLAPASAASFRVGGVTIDFQQLAQTQRQFTGLFRNPQDSFAVGFQSVFKRGDDDGHVELATGALLQSPIGFQDSHGNNFTIAAFANATWIDPLGHHGLFHFWSPYAQLQGQANATGPANPTLQFGLFPLNMNFDLDGDRLQLNVNGGATWNLLFTRDGVVSSWGPQIGVGLVGKVWVLGR